jgi:hypothetical protein
VRSFLLCLAIASALAAGACSSSPPVLPKPPSDGGFTDGGLVGCLAEGRVPAERFSAQDTCNFCECNADGSRSCTTRTCAVSPNGCTYDGTLRGYAERFASTDGCNECVCAASGLACTRRSCPGALEEGAILLESLDEPCGVDGFTVRSVLEGLPRSDVSAPFRYERARTHYPETHADGTVRVVIAPVEGGFAACRIPNVGQEAIDLEAVVEWATADGVFDEGIHTYLRKNAGGFLDAWILFGGLEPTELSGTYQPLCPDSGRIGFETLVYSNGSVEGAVFKTCETDIRLNVGTFVLPPL